MRKLSGRAGSIRVKSSPVEGAPAVAAVITGGVAAAAVRKAVSLGAGLLEVRVDTFTRTEPGSLLASFEKLKKITDLPILLTIRSSREGGQAGLNDRQRAALYGELIPFADLVDIELSSSGIRKNVVDSAKRAGKRVIVSHHDFESTPGDKKLRKIIESARASGGDMVKIASLVKSAADLRRLAGLLCSEDGLIVIGMGPLGKPSRVFFPFLGSLITYCSVTKSTAPGQMSLKEMRTELKRYGIQAR
jgi:3-dehydroquinate dehydratase-1